MLDKKELSESAQDELLAEIRADYTYAKDYWRENHEASCLDMQYMACDGWDADDKTSRANRPMVWPDELSQYVKQHNNSVRQNQTSIKLTPKGSGATEDDAQHRAGYIRGIEHASGAQGIYASAGESAAMCAMGFFRVKLVKTGESPGGKKYQEPRLARIPNWATVLPDPDAREMDFSDSRRYFVLDSMRQKAFSRKYPNAEKKSFTKHDVDLAADWFAGDNMVLAEAWRAEGDEWPWKVTQYICNGVEILESHQHIGGWIPIIAVLGEELYVEKSGTSKRVFMSLIRRALGAQKSLAFTASQELEEFGLSPRAPLQGWAGTFDATKHKNLHKIPMAYVEFNLPADWNPAWGAPQLPTRPQFEPQIEAYEAAIERWRRSIQAAVGVTFLPTDAQKLNQKSGIALDKIRDAADVGSFHFTDNLNRAKENAGRQINELITVLAELDALPPQVSVIKKDQTHALIKAVRSGVLAQQPDGDDYLVADRGEFNVTITTGASYESQRQQQDDFLDNIIANIKDLPVTPQQAAQIVGLALKLKPALGAVGEEISKILNPPPDENQQIPPQAQQAIQQAQAQIQQLSALVQKLLLERQGKVLELQTKERIEDKKNLVAMAEADKDRETKITVAEIGTQMQVMGERIAFVADMIKQLHSQAHDAGLQAQEHANSLEASQQAAQNQPPAVAPNPDQTSQ